MQVTFYGVRGSTPCHGGDIVRYGGNTSCVLVAAPGEEPLLFDVGTGARYVGTKFGRTEPFSGTCLLSHLHWDHTQGLPFFAPLLHPDSKLTVYGPAQEDGRSIGEVLSDTIRPPLFPIGLDEFPGTVECHDVSDSEFDVGGFHVTSRLVPHIGPTLGFRVQWRGITVTYLSDHQQPYDGSFSASDGALELVRGADLVIHDAQYTLHEFPMKATWGHCTVDYAVWLACQAKAKRLALFHHDPMRTDDALDELQRCARAAGQRFGVDVLAAVEGMTIEL